MSQAIAIAQIVFGGIICLGAVVIVGLYVHNLVTNPFGRDVKSHLIMAGVFAFLAIVGALLLLAAGAACPAV